MDITYINSGVNRKTICTNVLQTQKMILYTVLLLYFPLFCSCNEYCEKDSEKCINNNPIHRYLFYDVNAPEGFNLRRDVYMRYAVFAHKLKNSPKLNLNRFRLVLPPWSYMRHWKDSITAKHLPWSTFFDVPSLQLFAPVIEMHEFFTELPRKYTKAIIDEVYVLQHFSDMFETGNFEDRMAVEICQNPIHTSFFHYENVTSSDIKCVSFHGHATQLSELLEKSSSRTFLFDHAEVALHDHFGDKLYWQARRSMRFNKELVNSANKFREEYLNSTNESDGVFIPNDWRLEKPSRTAKGGPYLAVHLRRRDFLWSRTETVPSIGGAAKQISALLKMLDLNTVFVATDAADEEVSQLTKLLTPSYKVLRYEVRENYVDGQIAIIEQIICSYARYFIGTHESTFSFRIQEEREILGFPTKSTFNRFCGDDEKDCQKPSVWKIVY